MLNIRDIAKLSGVSTATVSRYMNKSGYVSQKSVEKIEKVLNTHKYYPNKLTNAIFNGRTNDIGLIVQNVLNPFFVQLINELENQAQELGYNLIICNTNGIVSREKKYYEELLGKRIAGLLVINTLDESIYLNSILPIIGIEKRINGFPKVSIDNESGIKQVIDKFISAKCTKVLFINGLNNFNSKIRTQTFEKLATNANIDYDIKTVADDFEKLYLLDEIEYKNYDFVFCWNDFIAHAVYKRLTLQNIKVPDHIQLVGFDGLLINEIFPYKLTTINQDFSKIGYEALNKIDSLIKKEEITDSYIEVALSIGDTTK